MAMYQTPPGSVTVLGPQFCAPYPVDLTITKKALSLSDGDFTVTDVNGGVLFKVKGKFFSVRDKRVLLDAAGNPLVSMKQKIMSMHDRWKVFKGGSTNDRDVLFTVKKSSFIQLLKTELDVYLASNTSEHHPDFKVKGSYLERSCTICVGGSNAIIAQMSRKYTVKNLALGRDTFGVTVYPNVDYAFISALVVILDEIHREEE